MRITNLISAACALGLLGIPQPAAASSAAEGAPGFAVIDGSVQMFDKAAPIAKAALTQTLGSRATVTSSATMYGGFSLVSSAVAYILVRGNSLGTLGITQAYLDLPRVHVYDGLGNNIVYDVFGNAGFNGCSTSNVYSAPVWNYYTFVRGQSPVDRDACVSLTLGPGVYTFTVTPTIPGVTAGISSPSSIPSFGDVLFEVTLNP